MTDQLWVWWIFFLPLASFIFIALIVRPFWDPGDGIKREVDSLFKVEFDVDRAKDYLESIEDEQGRWCDERLGGASDGNVPEGPIRSEGTCELEPPPWGHLQLSRDWRECDPADEISWLFDPRD